MCVLKRQEVYTHAILITIISYIITLLIIITLMIIRDIIIFLYSYGAVLCTIQFSEYKRAFYRRRNFPVRRDCAKRKKKGGGETVARVRTFGWPRRRSILKHASQTDCIIPRMFTSSGSSDNVLYNKWTSSFDRIFVHGAVSRKRARFETSPFTETNRKYRIVTRNCIYNFKLIYYYLLIIINNKIKYNLINY